MISQVYVVVCDGCGTIAKAKCCGTQRDSLWDAPDGWKNGPSHNGVHFCPKCTRKLAGIDGLTYRSNAEEL